MVRGGECLGGVLSRSRISVLVNGPAGEQIVQPGNLIGIPLRGGSVGFGDRLALRHQVGAGAGGFSGRALGLLQIVETGSKRLDFGSDFRRDALAEALEIALDELGALVAKGLDGATEVAEEPFRGLSLAFGGVEGRLLQSLDPPPGDLGGGIDRVLDRRDVGAVRTSEGHSAARPSRRDEC